MIAVALFVPVFADYARTGLIPRFPTLIASAFIALAVLQSFSGMILDTIARKSSQEFEKELQLVERECGGEIKHIVSQMY